MLLLISGELRCSYRVDRAASPFVPFLHGDRVEDDGEVTLLITEETEMMSSISLVR